MSTLLPAIAAAAPTAAAWSLHTMWMRRQLAAAQRDPLTGLHTRAPFERAGAQSLARGATAVVVVDLDGFKALNDAYGHAAGDAAIRAVGGSLAEALEGDQDGITARLGGDEFAAVVPMRDPIALPWLLGGLHGAICAPLRYGGHDLTVGASVGGCWTGDMPAPDLSAALRWADEAMYAAKRNGGGWRIADDTTAPLPTVNGRRAGRPGTHGGDGR
ncbi:GGDEF domain-containing protein [Streptomyces sp. NPDC048845]|uniref:GGDEF domain-containing protein n=1 Tax=Streptomyces sp. NPDC048845 TaxID=3155390 RepID=UPI00344640D8